MRLNSEQRRILVALQHGCHLKVHRDLDGAKVYRLHHPPARAVTTEEVASTIVETTIVETLERRGYLQSNLKFPAATLLLTERGVEAANTPAPLRPVGPRSY